MSKELLSQITNGTIDPNWVLTLIAGTTAFLLVRILNRMDRKLDTHDTKIAEHDTKIALLEKQVEQ
jgi:hypothetical protein